MWCSESTHLGFRYQQVSSLHIFGTFVFFAVFFCFGSMVTRAGRLLFSCSALAATVCKQAEQSRAEQSQNPSQCPPHQNASNMQLLPALALVESEVHAEKVPNKKGQDAALAWRHPAHTHKHTLKKLPAICPGGTFGQSHGTKKRPRDTKPGPRSAEAEFG